METFPNEYPKKGWKVVDETERLRSRLKRVLPENHPIQNPKNGFSFQELEKMAQDHIQEQLYDLVTSIFPACPVIVLVDVIGHSGEPFASFFYNYPGKQQVMDSILAHTQKIALSEN